MKQKHTFYKRKSTKKSLRPADLTIIILFEYYNHSTTTTTTTTTTGTAGRVCTGSSSTECWTFQLCSERVRTVQTVQKTVHGVDVPVISSDKFPQSRGSNPLASDSAHPQSGEHSCCATDFRRDPQVQFLVFWEVVDMPVFVQRQVLSF